MKSPKTYRAEFAGYPDLVTTKDLRTMLGGISENTALRLLRSKKIKSFLIRNRYHIPKDDIIDFLLSDDYASLQRRITHSRTDVSPEVIEANRQKILFLCEQPQTRKALMFLLDVSSKKTFFRLYLRPLLESGELQMTIPEQRSVSTQRYIRTQN